MWTILLRVVAGLLAIAVAASYVLQNGAFRTVSFIAIPILIVAFIEIRKKAGKVPIDEDPPWNG